MLEILLTTQAKPVTIFLWDCYKEFDGILFVSVYSYPFTLRLPERNFNAKLSNPETKEYKELRTELASSVIFHFISFCIIKQTRQLY